MTADPTQAYPVATLNDIVTDDQWEHYTGFLTSGVDAGDGPGALAVTLNASTRNAVVAPGGGWVKGRYRPKQAAADSVAIPAASSQDRIDRIVLRLNRTASLLPDAVKPVIITGTPASSPTKPAILDDATFYDEPLASYRATAAGTLTQLADERRFTGLDARSSPTVSPPPASTPAGSLWFQTDGVNSLGQLLVKQKTDGSHIVAAQDTGWVNLAITGFWQGISSNLPAIRAKNGCAFLAGAVSRTTNTLGAHDPNSPIAEVPAAYRPSREWKQGVTLANNPLRSGRLVVEPDGSLFLEYPTDDVPVGVFFYLSQVSGWPIG